MNALRAFARRRPALAAAAVVLGFYASWIGAYLGAGNDVRDFISIGPRFVLQGAVAEELRHGGPPRIGLDPGYEPSTRRGGTGFDGQFVYYLAVDPARARYYMDHPGYRYSRIALAMAARALALGDRDLIPWALVLVNWLAAGAGTWALATWLRRRGSSSWWALLLGLWPGMLVGIQRDLTEPLAYALVAAGVLAMDARTRKGLSAAVAAFALAGLARQSTLVFPAVYAVWLAAGGSIAGAAPPSVRARLAVATALLAGAVAPYVAYSAYLKSWLGEAPSTANLTPVPFGGIADADLSLGHHGVTLAFVVVPALVCLVALAPRRPPPHESWLPWLLLAVNLLANIVLFRGLFVGTYVSSISRVAVGVVLAAVMCVPFASDLRGRRRSAAVAAAAVAMAMLPVVAVQGFVSLSS